MDDFYWLRATPEGFFSEFLFFVFFFYLVVLENLFVELSIIGVGIDSQMIL